MSRAWDKARAAERARQYRIEQREEINARRRAAYAANGLNDKRKVWREANIEKARASLRAYGIRMRARLRAEMISAYGGACSCCGETEPKFLQLDHVHNDGAEERRKYPTSAQLWARLKRLDWPRARYQLLCANCNFGKALNDGVCPHELQRRIAA